MFARSSALWREYTRLGRVYPAALDWLLSSEEVAQDMQSAESSFNMHTDTSTDSSFGARDAAAFDRTRALVQGIARGAAVGASQSCWPKAQGPMMPAPKPLPSADRHRGATSELTTPI